MRQRRSKNRVKFNSQRQEAKKYEQHKNDFDYSETDVADLSSLSLKTVLREVPKLESLELITHTRNVGRAKMYRLNSDTEAVKCYLS